MRLEKIVLSAKKKSWRISDTHASEADSEFSSVRASVLERDDFTCRFCGFRSPPVKTRDGSVTSWQDVHHVNDDHSDNSMQNLMTACCFCHQCFHLGLAGIHGGGKLIWLPEVSQSDLNNIARAIFVARSGKGSYAEQATSLFGVLESRAQVIEEAFGRGSSNPAVLGQVFLELNDQAYAERSSRISGVRLLPLPGRFASQIAFWMGEKGAYKSVPPETWDNIVKEMDLFADDDDFEDDDLVSPLVYNDESGEQGISAAGMAQEEPLDTSWSDSENNDNESEEGRE